MKEKAAIKTQHTKKALLEALHKSMGVITTACQSVGVNRSTFYDYYKSDPEFAASADDIEQVALDFIESKAYQQINQGNTAMIIFYLKTKGKNRGFVERSEIDHTTDGNALPASVSVTILSSSPPVTSENDITE